MNDMHDEGTIDEKDEKKLKKFPGLKKLSLTILKHWNRMKMDAFPSNITCKINTVMEWIIKLREEVDATQVMIELKIFSKNNESLYLLVNNKWGGQDLLFNS